MNKRYDSKKIEDKWYNHWINKGYHMSSVDKTKKPYTIVIPPPNLTGNLHMGHALNNTYQDLLIRYKKMSGYNTCWVPGLDSGGIATQNVVEKQLAKEGINKENLGRKKFLEKVREWTQDKRKNILNQLKKIGCLCDWNREQFTMNKQLSSRVRKAFVQLYKKKLIYRGKYIVNWCPRCGTALADDEVEYKDQKSKLYYIKYPVGENYIVIATTRPETILGDTAVAFNPKDDRYNKMEGVEIIVPIVNRKVRLIADNYVKPGFGTGLVKITPAHDKNDYEIGKRHKLDSIRVIDKKGYICNTNTKYDGLNIWECRKNIVKELDELGLIEKIEDYDNKIGVCYRCKTHIEPSISKQWFVNMKPLKGKAFEAVNSGKVKLIPVHHVKIYNNWLNNMRDWCISRQIWYGHQIPIWYCKCGNIMCDIVDPTECDKCGGRLRQDSDVLDTWFSSALWAFSVFDKQTDLDYYFPTSVLVTGSDILFFWVTRMIIMTEELQNTIPFKHVYLHGIVRDNRGIKMSKTLGNGIDPLDVIKKYSADILRFTLVSLTPHGSDVNLSDDSFKVGKTFCTKLWNSVRYVLMYIDKELDVNINQSQLTLMDRWILHKLNNTITHTKQNLEKFDFSEACRCLYNFTWNDFCSRYIEYSKLYISSPRIQSILVCVIDRILRLLHPIIPFLTEELWVMLKPITGSKKDSILETTYPSKIDIGNYDVRNDMMINSYYNIISKIRSVRNDFKLKSDNEIEVVIKGGSQLTKFIKDNIAHIEKLIKGKIKQNISKTEKYLKYTVYNTIYIMVTSDFNLVDRIEQLQNKLKKLVKRRENVVRLQKNTKLSKNKKNRLEEDKFHHNTAILNIESELDKLQHI